MSALSGPSYTVLTMQHVIVIVSYTGCVCAVWTQLHSSYNAACHCDGVVYRTCLRCLDPVTQFFVSLKKPRFCASMDVYAPMFFCDLVTFLIVVFGYDKFGPSVSLVIFYLFVYFVDGRQVAARPAAGFTTQSPVTLTAWQPGSSSAFCQVYDSCLLYTSPSPRDS